MAQTDTSSRIHLVVAHSGRTAVRAVNGALQRAGLFIWKWSTLHRNSHRPDDRIYSSIWTKSIGKDSMLATLHAAFPNIPQNELPSDEEHVRRFLRQRFPPPIQVPAEELPANAERQQLQLLEEAPEETWLHVPADVRHLLAASNAIHMQQKLHILLDETYHPNAGLGSITRSTASIDKTFNMWKHGFASAVSWQERLGVNIFFIILTFSAVYPDVVAGFLGERSYNQRSVGSRIVTLCQLFFLWTFPFHSFWLLFNWSLERLLGAFVGNSMYALVAVVPTIRSSYDETWFRVMMLVLSMVWQVGVQFSLTVRDYLARLLTRRQMRALRKQSKSDDNIDWTDVDERIKWELVSHRSFVERQWDPATVLEPWQEVPIKVRAERYIRFTSNFELGRPVDQLIGLLKDDLECTLNIYEDYKLCAPRLDDARASSDKSHVEPRLPKFFLVFSDIVIFAYVCYSFWTQAFTFNTVVAYSTVVIVKQTIVAFKRYQTTRSARRVFTNMVSINIIGMLLVSTPVTVERDVLDDNVNMVILTLAMVLATLFLSEPIAPLLVAFVEKVVVILPGLAKGLGCR